MNIFEKLSPHAHWFMRLSVAATALYHGIEKLDVSHYLESTAACEGCLVAADATPVMVIFVVGILESLIGIVLIVGGFGKEMLTRVSAGTIAIFCVMGVVMHGPNGFSMMDQGNEVFWMMGSISLYFLIRGNKV